MDFVDVYGFAGGFAMGMTQSGFQLRGKKENPGGFGVPNMDRNRDLLGSRWQPQVDVPEEWEPVDVPVIAGNPPCSGFSMMSEPSFRGVNSKVNACMWALIDYSARTYKQYGNLQAIAWESVQGAFTKGYELMTALHAKLEEQTGAQWDLHHVLHDGFSVGGCQANRRRYFWVAVPHGMPFGVEPQPYRYRPTLNELIGDLSVLDLKWETQRGKLAPSQYLVDNDITVAPISLANSSTIYGLVDGHIGVDNPMNRKIAELVDWGDWQPKERMQDALKRHVEKHGAFPPGYDPKYCEKMLRTDFNMGFTQPFRWSYDESPRVIHGGAMYISVHPEENRCLTHREAARIMGFPDTWKIEALQDVKSLPLTWGKGIAVQAGRWIGEWLKESLAGRPGREHGTQVGDREWVIDVTSTRYGKPSQWRSVPQVAA